MTKRSSMIDEYHAAVARERRSAARRQIGFWWSDMICAFWGIDRTGPLHRSIDHARHQAEAVNRKHENYLNYLKTHPSVTVVGKPKRKTDAERAAFINNLAGKRVVEPPSDG